MRCLNRFPKKSSINKLHGNTSSGSRVVPCRRADRRTDITKLIVAFRNFANALKNVYLHCIKDVYEKNCIVGNSAQCVRTPICLQRTIFVQLFQQQFLEFRLEVKKKIIIHIVLSSLFPCAFVLSSHLLSGIFSTNFDAHF